MHYKSRVMGDYCFKKVGETKKKKRCGVVIRNGQTWFKLLYQVVICEEELLVRALECFTYVYNTVAGSKVLKTVF